MFFQNSVELEVPRCLPAFCNKDSPDAGWDDIPEEDKVSPAKPTCPVTPEDA